MSILLSTLLDLIIARTRTFLKSRTFPGKPCFDKWSLASWLIVNLSLELPKLFSRILLLEIRYSAISLISSDLSLKLGTLSSIVAILS